MTLRDAFPSVGFGTSGVRALVDDLTPEAVSAYVRAFAQHVGPRRGDSACIVGWDLRPSSPEIAAAVCAGLEAEGLTPVVVGALPSPAVALAGFARGVPSVMVTGSHIPFDRNGIKFCTDVGEILKADELAIAERDAGAVLTNIDVLEAAVVRWSRAIERLVTGGHRVRSEAVAAARAYLARSAALLPERALAGTRIGVYQHSAVGRDLVVALLEGRGAAVVPLGRSDVFVAIDTEAVSAEDEARAAAWCGEHDLDAVVSTDGDGDRPWLADERGRFVPGDVLGPLAAAWLGVRHIVTPVSSNSVAERSGWFDEVVRTRIGSPFVIHAMRTLAERAAPVAGYEANGGFLLQTPLERQGRRLEPLPTRDAALPLVAVLAQRADLGIPLSRLRERMPARCTASGRLQAIDRARVAALLGVLHDEAGTLLAPLGRDAAAIDNTDGVRLTLRDEDVVHLRLSGNAPELRCYVESDSDRSASALREAVLERVEALLASPA